ncbi:bifunctional peptidase and arginyl-hydroxylase JMJD5 isoform X2 [Neodiprion virginianus]|uniref:bifunctional peptidase and arginyl-hydroxylase JMJD5 isoform X2 n=1 Tax=Neodiprion virginianus TaxID=2961670 RepID=UPI001EE6CE15|nr:bifunctional peptidase and arginyl-hydroxylase JMJD5 isoform X2 [Neodiprion virginianus]
MDITWLCAKDFPLSEALLVDIESNSPLEIKVHLTLICRKLWASMNSTKIILTYKWLQDAIVTVEACLDRTWESLNSGCWKEVSIHYKYCYTFCTIIKSVLLLTQHKCKDAPTKSRIAQLKTFEDTILQIDKELKGKKCLKVENLMTFGCRALQRTELPGLSLVLHYHQPSMEAFYKDIFHPKIPAVLKGCMEHWKALELWRNPEYLLKIAGVRTVPIEIGSHYTAEDWTQRLLTFSEFIVSYMTSDTPPKLGYLAQHELFNQIPELMDDIAVPDYCNFTDSGVDAKSPDINAWLGPKGTISPLHFDPKNNLLCQVFGHKEVILFHPQQTSNLYPYKTKLLTNTARVDPTKPDFQKWPKFEKAIGMTSTLGPGEMLFIPPGWWHHVTALSQSFSVSFWWD